MYFYFKISSAFLLKDLQSTNILDNCIALSAVCHLVQSDVGVVSMMLPLVQKKLQHPRSVFYLSPIYLKLVQINTLVDNLNFSQCVIFYE